MIGFFHRTLFSLCSLFSFFSSLSFLAFFAFLALFMITGWSTKAMASDLSDAFNVLISNTSPGVYQSEVRGFMTAGGFDVHFPTNTVQLISVSPPEVNSGCAGISLFTGGLSYVSAQEFVDLLQGIASDTLGYSFELALKTLCPVCASVLSDLQRVAQAANRMAINQCQFSMGLVNSAIQSNSALQTYVLGEGANSEAEKGNTNDFLGSFNAFSGDISQALKAISNTLNNIEETGAKGERYNELPLGNNVWKALNGMNDTLRIFMQSLLGTTLRGPYTTREGSTALMVSPIAPSLNLDQLVTLFVYGVKAEESQGLYFNECDNTSSALFLGEPANSCSRVIKKTVLESTWYREHQSDTVGGVPISDVGFYGMSYALLFQALSNLERHEPLGTPEEITLPSSIYGDTGVSLSITASFTETQIESFIALAPLPLYRAINLGAIYADVSEVLVNNVSGIVGQHYAIAYLQHELSHVNEVGNVESGTLGLSPEIFQSITKALDHLQLQMDQKLSVVLSNLETTVAWTTQINQVQSLVYQDVLQSGLSENFAFAVGLTGN